MTNRPDNCIDTARGLNAWLRIISLAALLTPVLTAAAQEKADTAVVHDIQEVVVTSQNHVAIKDGVSYTPTPDERRRSANATELLGRLMIAGLSVDRFKNTVETSLGKQVAYFIDGQEAKDWEVKALRPKDVARVEYLQSPTDMKYKGAEAVVNFVMRQYDYGGYVYLGANEGMAYNYGDYDLAANLKKGKMTYKSMLNAYWDNNNGVVERSDANYNFGNGTWGNRQKNTDSDIDKRTYQGAFMARYDHNNIMWMMQAGLSFKEMPKSSTVGTVAYQGMANDQSATTRYDASTHNLLPYASATVQRLGLPHNAYIYANASFSYNHNNSRSLYTADGLTLPLANGYKENAYIPSLYFGYGIPVHKQNWLTAFAYLYSEIYRTQYTGTSDSRQKLTNSYYSLTLTYSHTFSQSWSGAARAIVPLFSYKVNDNPRVNKAYLNGLVTLSGRLGSKHSLYMALSLTKGNLSPNYYNSVVRQDNEIEGSRGNANINTPIYTSCNISYTWMPSNAFSLNVAVYWDGIYHDVVPYYHPEDGLMVKEMANGGEYHPIVTRVTPSLSLFGGKLRLSSMLSYVREWHKGLYRVNNEYIGIYPKVDCSIGKHVSVYANYNYSSGDGGYMRGGSYLGRFSNDFSIGAQYAKGNFFVSAKVYSLLRKNGWYKSMLNTLYFNDSGYLSRPRDRRYVSVSASFTFDFGKKTSHGDNMSFGASAHSSAL